MKASSLWKPPGAKPPTPGCLTAEYGRKNSSNDGGRRRSSNRAGEKQRFYQLPQIVVVQGPASRRRIGGL